MTRLQTARFVASAPTPGSFPPADRPEVAFAGRSNVGKSSAINALAARRRLAIASRTPGRTQAINFFELEGGARLVDLPGYGYAAAPHALREAWKELVAAYFESGRAVAGVVVLMDARHPLTPLDEGLLEWLAPLGVRTLALLTKADKLSRSERDATLARVRTQLAKRASGPRVVLFSSRTRDGVEAVRKTLEEWLRGGAPQPGIKSPR